MSILLRSTSRLRAKHLAAHIQFHRHNSTATMEHSDSLRSTLHSITSIKRQELAKQRDVCKQLRAELLEPVQGESNARERVKLLLKDAGKRLPVDRETTLKRRKQKTHEIPRKKESSQHEEILGLADLSAPNTQRFLEQSEKDASISPAYFQDIEKRFRDALRAQEIKYEYATLFSDLVTERSAENTDTQATSSDKPESVGRREMHEQRQEWESLVFKPLKLDQRQILQALEKVFSSPEAVQSLKELRESVEKLCRDLLQPGRIDSGRLKSSVNGLIGSDLLSDEQTAILKQFRNNPSWLGEIADVLNIRLAAIKRWTWETDAMPLEMRRQLNGKYRVYMHEETTQALLIYHIGIEFAVGFARLLDKFYTSSGWKKRIGLGRGDLAKFNYFIHERRMKNYASLEQKVTERFRNDYFMATLPRSMEEGAVGYGDDDLSEDTEQQGRVQRSVETKQALLHLVAAESLLADRLNEELVVLQTDFRWFGPSLSHDTIAAVMEFFGVTDEWRTFFGKFLHAPMRFIHDGPEGEIRTRQRGIPMSHVLGDFFGEACLFCVDFAVNEATGGRPMFRLHDDVWLWGKPEEATAAWEALTSLTKVMGIEINVDKTGAARLTRNKEVAKSRLPEALPTGALRWGFLSVHEDGQFTLDQAEIDVHISELRRQLASQKSVMAWIKAYNSYMRFINLNFCKPANALGRAHVEDCLAALRRIHEALFPEHQGNAAAKVKEMITTRFKVKDIPDGFIFFPMGVGGLELRNPYVSLQSMRDKVMEEPMDAIDEAFELEEVEYRRLNTIFDKSGPADKHALSSDSKPTKFLSRDEFAMFRRECTGFFLDSWNELLEQAVEEEVETTAANKVLLSKMPRDQAVALEQTGQKSYWKALVEVYGPEMGEVFGGLCVVEKGLLPMGMVELFQGKVRWEA